MEDFFPALTIKPETTEKNTIITFSKNRQSTEPRVPEAGLEVVDRAFAQIIDRINRLEREDLFSQIPTE